MSMARLTRRVHFNAAHRYYRPEWSETENRRVFGACANPHGHGHNYVLDVTVTGPIDPKTGFAVDLTMLDALLAREITERFDHQHLNFAVPEFRAGGLVPTTENIVALCWARLAAGLPDNVRLVQLRLHEDPTFHVDYFGGEEP
ncbi:MAG: 6-pyruvoyl trahydropterin synthase family protein [Longimicrobiales bacterium]